MIGFTEFLLILLIIILILNPVIVLTQCIWGLMIKLCLTPTDFKTKYGDWAVITGCTDGIGKEYTKELAKRNMNLVLISRSLEKLNKTREEIEKLNPNISIEIIQTDFSMGKEALINVKNQLKDIPVGILVNNVGVLSEYPKYLEEMKEEELWEMINVNISTLTLMTRIVIERMKKRGKGAIVNVSSAASTAPVPLMSVYSASKIFINFFSDAIREEYSKHGLTIQCLTPFYIRTKMIGYSDWFKANPLVPDAATYARNAIETLGKSNKTTGFWIHDILFLICLLSPVWIRSKIGFFINRITRRDYFTKQKLKVDN